MTRFHSTAIQFPSAWHHSKRRRRWMGINGSTRNGRCSPSARPFHMVREDAEAPSEGATCVWMAAFEAVGCT
ncbi:uncharacterized protein TNCV_4378431 [Trichonephila clavipes]|nr:uncharacterized protein TNCV_4378431 [Trichonephila clavipes]